MPENQLPGDEAAVAAVQNDSRTPAQSFELVMARYKARMYERYSYEIGRKERNAFTCLLPANGSEKSNQPDSVR
jgi:hypothetical protein